MKPFALVALLILAACGADGDPLTPTRAETSTGLQVNGTAWFGVSTTLN